MKVRLKNKIRTMLPILALFLIVALCFDILSISFTRGQSYGLSSNEINSDLFSIIHITDTQYLSSSSDSSDWNALTSWIVNQSAALNLKMVIHTGDIVDNGSLSYQWKYANAAMMILQDSNVPYCWCAGNHDQLNSDGKLPSTIGYPNGTWLGNSYQAFNLTLMKQMPYWVSDLYDGKNTAVRFTYKGYNFLVVNIEYDANSSVLNWMTNLFGQYPNDNVIVATHFYLNGMADYRDMYGGSATWSLKLQEIINYYPNVFLTLNGHFSPYSFGSNHTRVENREEVFFNYQDVNYPHGAATAQIFTFNLTSKICAVTTYQVFNNTWANDAYNNFNFSLQGISFLTTSAPLSSPTPQTSTIINASFLPVPSPTSSMGSFLTPSLTPNSTNILPSSIPNQLSSASPFSSPIPSQTTSVPEFDPIIILAVITGITTVLTLKKLKSKRTILNLFRE